MVINMKKFLALILSVFLVAGVTLTAFAAEATLMPVGTYTSTKLVDGEYLTVETPVTLTLRATPETINVDGTPRLMLPYVFENVYVSTSSITGVYVNVELSVVENTNNHSGFEIVGVRTPEYVDNTGYYRVDDEVVLVSTTYYDNRQTVKLVLQFKTKSSATDYTWDTVTADTTLSFLD